MTASRNALVRWITTATSDPKENNPIIPWMTKSMIETTPTFRRVELTPKALAANTVVTISMMKVSVPQTR